MTSRELFKAFYGLARMNEGQIYGCCPFADEVEVVTIACAVRGGIDDMAILGIKHSAALALDARSAAKKEPSGRSVYIQTLVHTFGRVRRSL